MPIHPVFQDMLEKAANMPPNSNLSLETIRQANLAIIPMLGEPENLEDTATALRAAFEPVAGKAVQ